MPVDTPISQNQCGLHYFQVAYRTTYHIHMPDSVNVLVELRKVQKDFDLAPEDLASSLNKSIVSLRIDPNYPPVPMHSNDKLVMDEETTVIVRGTVDPNDIIALKNSPEVVAVYSDPRISPFGTRENAQEHIASIADATGFDCSSHVAKGDFASVARKIGADRAWEKGATGQGVTIGIVDGGLLSAKYFGLAGVRNVKNGYPANWGKLADWDGHGRMVATTALSIAPDVELYDIRLTDKNLLSDALQGFAWAINEFQKTGAPQILANSWGIDRPDQNDEAVTYANNIGHAFTLKVSEAIQTGIIVVFAAGNCGAPCPDDSCGPYHGPGKSIWGANGLEEVITVGAVNTRDEPIGYSSQGPAALHKFKPDICGVSHFQGSSKIHTGTSAACPIVAAAAALLKQSNPQLDGYQARQLLIKTAHQSGDEKGWNAQTGQGLVQVHTALDKMTTS